MSKPILYYTPFSPPTRSVLMTAKQIGLELELKHIDLFKLEQFSDEFRKINPQHTVPTLRDGNFILWDSHAICTYLIGKYGKDDTLYPADLQKRAKIDQRLHFDSSVMFPVARNLIEKIMFLGAKEIPEEYKIRMERAYEFLEIFLESDYYLGGNTLSVADLCLSPVIATFKEILPFNELIYPKLCEYLNRVMKLDYFDEVNKSGIEATHDMLRKKLIENKRVKKESVIVVKSK